MGAKRMPGTNERTALFYNVGEENIRRARGRDLMAELERQEQKYTDLMYERGLAAKGRDKRAGISKTWRSLINRYIRAKWWSGAASMSKEERKDMFERMQSILLEKTRKQQRKLFPRMNLLKRDGTLTSTERSALKTYVGKRIGVAYEAVAKAISAESIQE